DGGPGGWWILFEPELHFLSGDIVVPDIAGWRLERMPELPTTAYFTLSPDWICEVLSPSTAAEDRADKMPIYADAGVSHAWLIDPLVRTLEVMRLEQGRWFVRAAFRGDSVVRAEPFESIELSLADLWSPPRRS
ncbi:MAG: Uma2 family endonuclease, partial [Polyangiales bacterium]